MTIHLGSVIFKGQRGMTKENRNWQEQEKKKFFLLFNSTFTVAI
jgi:hypothetical protein